MYYPGASSMTTQSLIKNRQSSDREEVLQQQLIITQLKGDLQTLKIQYDHNKKDLDNLVYEKKNKEYEKELKELKKLYEKEVHQNSVKTAELEGIQIKLKNAEENLQKYDEMKKKFEKQQNEVLSFKQEVVNMDANQKVSVADFQKQIEVLNVHLNTVSRENQMLREQNDHLREHNHIIGDRLQRNEFYLKDLMKCGYVDEKYNNDPQYQAYPYYNPSRQYQ